MRLRFEGSTILAEQPAWKDYKHHFRSHDGSDVADGQSEGEENCRGFLGLDDVGSGTAKTDLRVKLGRDIAAAPGTPCEPASSTCVIPSSKASAI